MKNKKENKNKLDEIVIPLSKLELSQIKDGTIHNWKAKTHNGKVVKLKIMLDDEGNWGF